MDEIKDYPPYLDYPKPYKAQTNSDRIRAMSDEELAELLNQWGTSTRAWQKDKGETMYWLQQPAEEDENGV